MSAQITFQASELGWTSGFHASSIVVRSATYWLLSDIKDVDDDTCGWVYRHNGSTQLPDITVYDD